MSNIIYILLTLLFGTFAAGSFYVSCRERAERKQAERELNEARNNAEKTADKITEANKIKADARSGDHDSDFEFMANKLRDYSNK